MTKKNGYATIGLLLIALMMLFISKEARAQQSLNGNFIFINYIGQEVTLDLDDITYIVPGTSTAPQGGKLVLTLQAGEHKYAASVPGVGLGSAGEFTSDGSGVVAKAARIERTGPSVDRNGIVLEEPKDKVVIFNFDPFAPATQETPVEDVWQPAIAPAGKGSLVWVNHWGDDEVTIDLNGTIYKVPPAMNGVPGRLQVEVTPGFYRYTASVPYGSVNNEINVAAGQVTGINIYSDPLPEPKFEVGEESPLPLAVPLRSYQENLTNQAITTAPAATNTMDSIPLGLPETGGVLSTQPTAPLKPAVTGVVVKNYAGGALVFTIDGQAYVIDNQAEKTLPLLPGHYSYTASLPFVATTGIVDLEKGTTVEVSIVLNPARDFMTAYQN
jgi:hypothetical protein